MSRSSAPNPVYASNAADPFGLVVGDAVYVYTTNTSAHTMPVLRSTDLVDWELVGDAMPAIGPWVRPGRHWAPEILSLAHDRHLAYYTAANAATGRQAVGVAVADNPVGPFVDRSDGPLVDQAAIGGAIDASPFVDADGSLYLLWKNDGNALSQRSWIWGQRLSADGLSLVGEAAQLLTHDVDWEGKLVEAPFLWRRGSTYLLFYAANAFDQPDYAQGYAVGTSPLGPFVKPAATPFLASGAGAAGPGHASMIEVDGRTWLLYHAWREGQVGTDPPGREMWIDEVAWDGDRPICHGPSKYPFTTEEGRLP